MEQGQLEETKERVLYQREEILTESLDEEGTSEVVQKPADKLLLVMPQFTATVEKSYAMQEETVTVNSQAVQPSATVESVALLVHVVDETEGLVVKTEKETSICVSNTVVAVDEIPEKEVLKASQSKMEEGAIATEAEVAAETVEDVPAVQTEETVEKPDETVEEPLIVCQEVQAKKMEHLQKEIKATDHLAETETLPTNAQGETTSVLQCTETICDDESGIEFEIMLPTNESVLTHEITDTRVEGYDKCDEVMQLEIEECGAKVAEETTHVRLYVGHQGISSTEVQMMLPVIDDDTLSVVSDVAEMTQAVESVAASTDEMHIVMSALHLEAKDIEDDDILADSDFEVVHHEGVEHEAKTFLIDIQTAVLMTPQVIEGKASILNTLPDAETENDGQDDRLIETLRPVMYEKEFAMKDSQQFVSCIEEIEISMRKDTEHSELTMAHSSEEASDIETYDEEETMQPVIAEAVARAMVFSSKAEHEVDLLVIKHAFDMHERIGIATDEMATTLFHSEDENVGELLEVDTTNGEKMKDEPCWVDLPVVAEPTMQHCQVASEIESVNNEVALSVLYTTDKQQEVTKDVRFLRPKIQDIEAEITTVTDEALTVMRPTEGEGLCEIKVADDSIVTMHLNCVYVPGETEVSHIVFPTLPTSDRVPDVASVDEVALCDDDTTRKMLDDTLQFQTLETPSHLETDSMMENTPTMKGAKCTVLEDVQPEFFVPYSSSVIVRSGDMHAQNDVILEHLSDSLVDKRVADSVHITEVQVSGQAECTLSINEEFLCDNLTVVFPENVESSLLGDQPSFGIAEIQIVDFLEHSGLFDSSLINSAEKYELQMDSNIQQLFQLQNAASESTVIEMRLLDEGDTLTARPEKPEFSESVSVEEKGTESVDTDDDKFHDEVDKSHTDEAVKLVVSDLVDDNVYTVGPQKSLSDSDQMFDTLCATASECQRLEPEYVDHTTSSSLEFLEDVQTQQFEASVLPESFTDHAEVSHIETPSTESEHEVEKQAISFETSKLIEVDGEESEATEACETINIEHMSCEVVTDDSQHNEPETVKSEDTLKSSVDLPWNVLFASLLDVDSTESVRLSGDVNKEDDGPQGIKASDMEREKHAEHEVVTDDRPAEFSAGSKSSVITRRVQRVSADGRVVEKVKSEEVPTSLGPASLTPYFFGDNLPSPPDFSPQSDDRHSPASSIKVYTDTVEGEPWTERRVEEVKETQPDGVTITRKVVRVRKRRTIIKHIVIEGPEFEEMVFDEPDKYATTAEALSSEITGTSSVEGDFRSCVDEQIELFASECKQSNMDSAPRQLLVESDTLISSKDFSYTGLSVNVETDHTQSVDKPCSYIKEKTTERAVGSEEDADKDTTSSLPPQHASLGIPLSLDLSHARVSSQGSLLGEAKHYGESEYFPLDFDHDTSSCSVGEGPWLDNAESASSCGDFATGILLYSHT